MASDDKRTCPIFRIEPGTFEESHTRTMNSEYPSFNDDQDVFLRVTKVPSGTNSPSATSRGSSHLYKTSLINSLPPNRDSWDDTGRTLIDGNSDRGHSLSDDYVFL